MKDVKISTIKKMESIKAHLLTTQNQLRLANNKVEDVSVKKLTYNNPTNNIATPNLFLNTLKIITLVII